MFLRDHLDDIASDLSVFHRIDDVLGLDGPTLWRLAWRLPHYRGCMRGVVERLQADEETGTSQASPRPARSSTSPIVQGTATALQSAPAFAADGMFGPVFEVTEIKAT